jgi:hypothetical protein
VVKLDPSRTLETLAGRVVRARYPLRFSPKPEEYAPSGIRSGFLAVALSDGAACSAEVNWTFSSPFEAEPRVVHFGTLEPGGPPGRAEIEVRATDGRPFVIEAVEGGPVGIVSVGSAGFPTRPAASHSLTLTLPIWPDEGRRTASGRLHIKADRAGDPEIVVPWSAFSGRPGKASEVQTPAPPTDERSGS